jgi:hypothetical protein
VRKAIRALGNVIRKIKLLNVKANFVKTQKAFFIKFTMKVEDGDFSAAAFLRSNKLKPFLI